MKNILKLVLKEENGYRLIKQFKFSGDRDNVNYKGKVFAVDLSKPSYITNKNRVFIIDYETREQYNFKQLDKPNPTKFQILDSLITRRTIAQLLAEEPAWNIVSLIIGAVMGVLAGILIGVVFL
jgi:hypothetical protein